MKIAILALLLMCLIGCGDLYRYFKSGEVGWALKKEIRNKHANVVSIAGLTRFKWDELFLFGPYAPASEMCKKLSLAPDACRASITTVSTDDGEMMMVFRNRGKVVHTEMHFRCHGDFTPVPDKPFTPNTAVFKVVVDGKGTYSREWLRLVPVISK